MKTEGVGLEGPDGQTRINLRVAESEEDRQAVYRFRYAVYVEQMKRRQTYADHARKIIREPLDENGCIVAAFKGDQVVATLRANFMSDPAANYYRKLYRVDLFEGLPLERMTMNTKLMVTPDLRATPLPLKLIVYMAKSFHYRVGCLIDFLDCNKPLISLFNRYGYVSYIGWTFHREYGKVRPMFCAASDLEFLGQVNSPFLRVAHEAGYSHCNHSEKTRSRLAKE